MTQYLITFGAHAMDHLADDDMPAIDEAAHAVCQEAIDAGVYVLAGGLEDEKASVIVATDGTVSDGRYPDAIGGITVVDVSSREEGLKWAAKIAGACRCAVEVSEIGADPKLDAMLRHRWATAAAAATATATATADE
ncbi:MAG: YciI family protein [Acidimicrobiales bacterium]